jgi:DeoR family transcriptional regulator, suf operon transcriptional repressor
VLTRFGQRQRQLLALLLENKAGLTIDELVSALGVTRTAVYQHMASLEKDGYVEKHRLTETGGRPGQSYILTERGMNLFPKQYAWFSQLLLNTLKEKLGSDGLESALRESGRQLAGVLSGRMAGKDAAGQVMEMVGILQELGYQASAVPDDDGSALPVIRACNCVYHQIAKEMPEVCQLDLSLMSTLLGREIEHLECMARGGQTCRFRVGDASKRAAIENPPS